MLIPLITSVPPDGGGRLTEGPQFNGVGLQGLPFQIKSLSGLGHSTWESTLLTPRGTVRQVLLLISSVLMEQLRQLLQDSFKPAQCDVKAQAPMN